MERRHELAVKYGMDLWLLLLWLALSEIERLTHCYLAIFSFSHDWNGLFLSV